MENQLMDPQWDSLLTFELPFININNHFLIMGFLRTFIIFPFIFLGCATYSAFSLGSLLPVASR